jgi:hypothetical protein
VVRVYQKACQRLTRLLCVLLLLDLLGCLTSPLIVDNEWRTFLWIASGLSICLIARRSVEGPTFVDEGLSFDEDFHATSFGRRVLQLGNALGVTAFVVAEISGTPFWYSLLIAILVWFSSLFAILLVCTHGLRPEEKVDQEYDAMTHASRDGLACRPTRTLLAARFGDVSQRGGSLS